MRLAADANVLLASVLGGRSRLVFSSPKVQEVFTTEPTIVEVREYAARLGRKKGVSGDLLLLAVASLPVTVVPAAEYAKSVAEARRRIARRDPDDVPMLALALQFDIPIWSNDRDFEDARVPLLTTEALLRRLGVLNR